MEKNGRSFGKTSRDSSETSVKVFKYRVATGPWNSWMFLNILEFYLVLNCSWKSVCFQPWFLNVLEFFNSMNIFVLHVLCFRYMVLLSDLYNLTLGIWIFYFCPWKPLFCSWNVLKLLLNFFYNLSGHPEILPLYNYFEIRKARLGCVILFYEVN